MNKINFHMKNAKFSLWDNFLNTTYCILESFFNIICLGFFLNTVFKSVFSYHIGTEISAPIKNAKEVPTHSPFPRTLVFYEGRASLGTLPAS